MYKPTGTSLVQRREKHAELLKVAKQLDAQYDRASRHIGDNEEECSRLYHEVQAAYTAANEYNRS